MNKYQISLGNPWTSGVHGSSPKSYGVPQAAEEQTDRRITSPSGTYIEIMIKRLEKQITKDFYKR